MRSPERSAPAGNAFFIYRPWLLRWFFCARGGCTGQAGCGALLNSRAMLVCRTHRRLTAWLTALAVMLCGLLPVLSHAVVSVQGDTPGWVEVCTVSGMAWVKPLPTDSGNERPLSHPMPGSLVSLDHCGWCATHNPLTGLPPLVAALVAPPSFGPSVPPAFLYAPRPLFVWAAAHSRAPPLSA